MISEVFPGGNTLVRRSAVISVGGFDRQYDKGIRADGDLGCRLRRAGFFLGFFPATAVFHHRAPRGGLRTHGARVHTYASTRQSLVQRHLMAPTEVYLALRHFGRSAMYAEIAIRSFATLRAHGPLKLRLGKILVGLALFPHTLAMHWKSVRDGQRLHKAGPLLLDANVRKPDPMATAEAGAAN